MAIRVEYEVRKLPDSYITDEMLYSFVDDEKAPPDRFGRKRQKMVMQKSKSKGGYLFIIRGKPGHTIRLTSLDQLESFGLKTTPKLIDANTGEEVDKNGVPLIVGQMLDVERQFGNLSGSHGTDIDVLSNVDAAEEDMSQGLDDGEHHAIDESVVDNAIAKLEE